MTMIKIRKAKSSDWKILQKLNNQVFLADKDHDDDLDTNWPFSKKGITYYKELARGKYGHCLIAYSKKEAVGYVALAKKDFGYRLSKYIEIENMGVSPNFRSKGIGAQLVKKCLELAKKKGYQKVYVNAYFENVEAIAFYEKCGLKKIDVSLEKNI